MLASGTPRPAPLVSRLDFAVALALLALTVLLLRLTVPDGLAALDAAAVMFGQGLGCLGRPDWLC